MTTPLHPGPWRVGKLYGSIVTDVEGPGVWTDPENREGYGGFLVCESVRSPETAQLIAAAPELLVALKKAVHTIRTWHGMGLGPREAQAWSLYQASPEMRAILAALEKAEPRTTPAHESTQPCGCDPGENYKCQRHREAQA